VIVIILVITTYLVNENQPGLHSALLVTWYSFSLLETRILATESTEGHENIAYLLLFFRVIPWIPWL
jgi:hypothetical protein